MIQVQFIRDRLLQASQSVHWTCSSGTGCVQTPLPAPWLEKGRSLSLPPYGSHCGKQYLTHILAPQPLTDGVVMLLALGAGGRAGTSSPRRGPGARLPLVGGPRGDGGSGLVGTSCVCTTTGFWAPSREAAGRWSGSPPGSSRLWHGAALQKQRTCQKRRVRLQPRACRHARRGARTLTRRSLYLCLVLHITVTY